MSAYYTVSHFCVQYNIHDHNNRPLPPQSPSVLITPYDPPLQVLAVSELYRDGFPPSLP